jgi:hypothetical protein
MAAPPAGAAMKIKRIAFNPPGEDSGTNRHLVREYVYLVNTGPNDVQLRGWKVIDRGRDHVYRFSSLFLEPGDTIHLRTGRGSDGAPVCEEGTECPENAHYDFYWKLDNYVWNNDGDRAKLIRPNGNVVDQCAYSGSADSPAAC